MAQIRANGVNLEYDETGPADGVPLLLIMGFSAQMTAWTPAFRQALADRGLRVIRFDNRDVGLSQHFEGAPDMAQVTAAMAQGGKPEVPYDLRDMAADAAGLLESLGVDSAHILGASMGGMIAQLVAIGHPNRTRSLISVFSTTNDPSLPPRSAEAQAALHTPPPSTARADVIAHAVKNGKVSASTRWPTPDDVAAARVGAAYDRAFDPAGVARQYAAVFATPPRVEALKALDTPALVMHGTSDPLFVWQAGLHTAQCIRGAEFVLIDGWGHDIPDAGVPLLTDYIAGFVHRAEAAR